MSRERIRQIIESTFTLKLEEEDKVSLYGIVKVIYQYPLVWVEELKSVLVESGFTETGLHDQGLQNLLETFGICQDYEFYTSSFEEATRSHFERGASLFITRRERQLAAQWLKGQLTYFDRNYETEEQ